MNYLEGMMDNEVLYFARVNRENRTTPQVILLSLNVVGDKIIGAFTSLIDDMSENKNRAVFTSRGNHFTEKYMRKNGLQEWINNVGFVLIDKEKSNEYRRRAESGTISFNDVVAEIESKKNSKKIKEENTVSVDKCNFVSKSDSAKNTDTNMNHIIRLAKTSNDYRNFMELYNMFEDIGFTNVYHAVTGSGSITAADAEIIRSGKLKCSADSVRRATDILTYESKFKDIVSAVGGRRDYFNIALAFCFNHPEIDNNILLKRLRKNYGEMTKIKSITDALRKIEKIYNNRRKPKVALEHDYLRSRNE